MATTEITFRNRVTFLQKVWALSWPYFWSEQRTAARLLLGIIVVMTLAIVGMDVVFNYWYKDFYNALQTKDEADFWHQLLKFTVIAVIYILLFVYNQYLQQMLHIRWRKWLTERLLRKWLRDRTYYKLQFGSGGADNPEQRIEQDIHFFAMNAIALPLGLLKAVVTLVSFVVILWTISGPLSFALAGREITIPGYMVWVAVIYAAVGSWLTYRIGRPLIPTNFGLQKSNATFRYGMTRLRENAESVAFYRGEATEERELNFKFDQVWHFWWDYMRQQKRLSWFLSGYAQIAIIFPFVVASPRYFSGAIELGVLMQIASAFGNVQGALSWFVNNFGGDTDSGLAPWKATIDRLTGFVDAMERAEKSETGFDLQPSDRPELAVQDATLALPNGQNLIENLSVKISAGDKVLISGPSGSGKTTLFRTIAGIWPFGSGKIAQPPSGRALFLPQRPYLPIGSLRSTLAYPAEAGTMDESQMRGSLIDVGLAPLADRLDEEADWSQELSGGEQQRLAVARALLLKPDWLYLDEATSALDTANEQRMYALLAERLPDTTVLSIAHRPDVGKYHGRRLALDPDNRRATVTPIAAE
jgi:putative ATP-binding cassette transporter